jgi:DNA-binding CsgD family transcriptional regulator
MRDLLGDAEAGQPVVLLVSGDAGVGKTRLLTELAAEAAQRGFTILSGRCAELAETVPYLPLADALRSASGSRLADALASRPVLTQLLPDREITRQPGDLPGLAQQQLFGAVVGMLTELAEAQPVLLMLEDLHWSDRSTRDLVTFLSRVLRQERIALALSYRTDDMHRAHPLRPVVGELLRLPSVTAIDVGPLDPEAMSMHLTSLAGSLQDAAAIDRVIERAEGNPYFAEELLASSSAGNDLPTGLADLLVARTLDLSPAAQQVLRVAAVTGRRIDDELVMHATGLPVADYDVAVREAVAHQLLVADDGKGLAFRHALLREAVYNDLLPGERSRLHARFAELLADRAGSAAELAVHCLASHDIPGGFAASVAAAQEAWRLAAPAEAHRHFDQALSLWERVPEPEKLAGMGRDKLAFKSALGAADSGQVSLAVKQLGRLVGYLRDQPEQDLVLLCRVQERLAYFLLDVDEDAEAIASASAAADVLPAEPPTWERAQALATHAKTLLSCTDTAPAKARAIEAEAAAQAAGAPWLEADALATLSTLSERAGLIADAKATGARALELASSSDMAGVELRVRTLLARIELESGDLAAAGLTAHLGVERAIQTGLSMAPYGTDLQYLHYLAHYNDGNWDQAQEISDGFPVRVTNISEARLSAMALFIDVARGSSRVAERRAWLEPYMAVDSLAEYIGEGLFAEDAYWSGDLAGALTAVKATIGAATAWGGDEYGPQVIRPAAIGIAALGDQARLARAAGQSADGLVDEAAELAQIARQALDSSRRVAAAVGVDGRGWLARAEAELRRAADDNAPDNWRAVVDTFGPGFVYEAARSQWRLAEALAEAGDRDEAQHQWQLAAAAADKLGATRLRAALADLGRRARLGASSRAVAGSPLSVLTSRELEVLHALASGRSNREIAAELFISGKTVSVHVSNILAKLGAASRTEAAAIAHDNGIRGR